MTARSTGSHGSIWKRPAADHSPEEVSVSNGTRLRCGFPLPWSSPMDSVVPQDVALAEALERYWGYTSFRPLQREAMNAILAGRDSIVVLPTGGGKSLCFQAPAVLHDRLAVVVSPLISLMKDQ